MNDIQVAEIAEREEVFRGHFEECLDHLWHCFNAHFPKALRGTEKARQPIADFCGVEAKTVGEWMKGRSSIVGEGRIKLMCYLDLLGYRVIELEKLRTMKELAEVIGYGVLTSKQVGELLGYVKIQDVYNVLLLKRGTSKEKQERARGICAEKRAELTQKKEEACQKFCLGFSLMDSVQQRKVSAIVSIMEGLLAMLESSEIGKPFSDNLQNLSPQERGTILRLSDSFHALASEMVMQNRRQESGDEQV